MREDLLKAMQMLGIEGDPHEAIASKFARIFSDRMTQKRELLERVRSGGDLSDLLVPEVDEQVDVPIVSRGEGTPLSHVRATDATRRNSRKRRTLDLPRSRFSSRSSAARASVRICACAAKPAAAEAREATLAVVPTPSRARRSTSARSSRSRRRRSTNTS